MAEWSIAAVLKTVELRGSGGSNPSLSAKRTYKELSFNLVGFFYAQKNAPKLHHPISTHSYGLFLRPKQIAKLLDYSINTIYTYKTRINNATDLTPEQLIQSVMQIK